MSICAERSGAERKSRAFTNLVSTATSFSRLHQGSLASLAHLLRRKVPRDNHHYGSPAKITPGFVDEPQLGDVGQVLRPAVPQQTLVLQARFLVLIHLLELRRAKKVRMRMRIRIEWNYVI